MKVMKFGGTSVGSATRMKGVVELVNDGETKIVVSQLKELLGHTPVEVLGGIILGITIATLFKGF